MGALCHSDGFHVSRDTIQPLIAMVMRLDDRSASSVQRQRLPWGLDHADSTPTCLLCQKGVPLERIFKQVSHTFQRGCYLFFPYCPTVIHGQICLPLPGRPCSSLRGRGNDQLADCGGRALVCTVRSANSLDDTRYGPIRTRLQVCVGFFLEGTAAPRGETTRCPGWNIPRDVSLVAPEVVDILDICQCT